MKWMKKKSFIACATQYGAVRVWGRILSHAESSVGVLSCKGVGGCIFSLALLPLQFAWLGSPVPAWMQSLLWATRRCLWFLCVSLVPVHLERCMIGKFPILVFWRNIQIDINLLWRMNFCSCDRFFWFDSITSKLLLMHIKKLNCASPYTIS